VDRQAKLKQRVTLDIQPFSLSFLMKIKAIMFLQKFLPRSNNKNKNYNVIQHFVPKSFQGQKSSGKQHKFKIAAATTVILSLIVGHALVITGSDGQLVRSWKLRPSVIVPVFSGIFHGLLAYLLSTGTAMNWWEEAKRGTTLEHLHQITNKEILLEWPPFRKLSGFLFRNAAFTKVFLTTTIFTLVALSAGPMLQKATSTTNLEFTKEGVEKNINILSELPDGISGNFSTQMYAAGEDFVASISAWYRNDTIETPKAPGYTCDGRCRGLIRAPSISVDCVRSENLVDLRNEINPEAYLFLINMTITEIEPGKPVLDFTAIHSASVDADCIGTIVTDKCSIHMAIAEFPIILDDNVIVLEQQTISEMNSPNRTYSAGDMLKIAKDQLTGPLRGLTYASKVFIESLTKVPARSVWETRGAPAEFFFIYRNSTPQAQIPPQGCHIMWRSPTEWALNSLREILFRVAIDSNKVAKSTLAGNGTPLPQKFITTQVTTEIAFESNYSWLAGALTVEVIAVVLAMMLTWGWWDLEREVGMSPVETVQAIPMEVIAKIKDRVDMDAENIVRLDGISRVRYNKTSAGLDGGTELQTVV
jgi:hypothetical protein